jgi:hypothetical protein
MSFLAAREFHWVQWLCAWAAVGDVFPFWELSGLYFLQDGPYVLVIQLFPSQSGWIPAGCGCSLNSSYLLDVFPRLVFVAVDTLFSAWSSALLCFRP